MVIGFGTMGEEISQLIVSDGMRCENSGHVEGDRRKDLLGNRNRSVQVEWQGASSSARARRNDTWIGVS